MTEDPLTTDELRRLVAGLGTMAPAADDADGIERVRLFEQLAAVAAAAQMREAVTVAASLEANNTAAGEPRERRSRGVAAQLGLARRISPHQAQRWLGCARVLTDELPATFAALASGRTTAWRAIIVARETLFLSRAHRAEVDTEVAARIDTLGDRGVERAARAAALRLDPAGAAARARRAAADRHVSIRPAPDTMCRLSALVPAASGIAAYAALRQHTDAVIGTGRQGTNADGTLRGRGQVMADTLVERLTGQSAADDVAVEITLVMNPEDLIGAEAARPAKPDGTAAASAAAPTDVPAADEPAAAADAVLLGYGPVPVPLARDLALGSANGRAPRWLRRLFTTPDGTGLAALDSRRRIFTPAQRRYIRLRDHDTCRTPWCDAPIRHIDHVIAADHDGQTQVDNGQGLCEACNYAKQAPGWSSAPLPDGAIQMITPTGHVYLSPLLHPPGARPADDPDDESPVERFLREAIRRAA